MTKCKGGKQSIMHSIKIKTQLKTESCSDNALSDMQLGSGQWCTNRCITLSHLFAEQLLRNSLLSYHFWRGKHRTAVIAYLSETGFGWGLAISNDQLRCLKSPLGRKLWVGHAGTSLALFVGEEDAVERVFYKRRYICSLSCFNSLLHSSLH